MEELIRQFLNGDKEAFTKLIQIIQNDLFRIAKTRLDNIDDINDAIQETMIFAYKNLKNLREIKYFKTWIIKILINECNKIYLHNHKRISLFDRISNLKKGNISEEIDLLNIDGKLELEDILEKLNYEEKIAVVLFYNSNYTIAEISEILNTSTNTIKSRINRAKQKIKKYYLGGVENETVEK